MRKSTILVLAGGLCLLAPAAWGQVNCSDGTFYDDGSFEEGAGLNEANVSRGTYVQRIDPPFTPAQIDSVCICWVRTGPDSSIGLDIDVWTVDGSGNPGTLLGRVTGQQATGVSAPVSSPFFGSFYRYDLRAAGIVTNGPVFIGPSWLPKTDTDFFLCEDQSAGTPDRPVFVWASAGTDYGRPNLNPRLVDPLLSALGIRAKFSAASGCVPSDTALCLNRGRFKVEATFTVAGQPSGTAHVVKLTDETGYLWFFSDTNVEAVVKVLDACTFNQRFWVFAGGLTNVQVQLTITDTRTGTVKTYNNPQGAAFQPIQDTSAFATCP